MASYRAGLFLLVDPPTDDSRATAEEYATIVADVRRQIDFPWHRLIPGLRRKGRSAIEVRWGTSDVMPAQSIGFYQPDTCTIWISYQYGPSGTGFTFAHEVGHAVDALTFTWEQQQAIMAFWHTLRCRYHGQQANGVMHGWAHENPHSENWVSRNDYLFRHSEAYADAFVAAFAPEVWAPRGPWGRFVHWPTDYTADGRQIEFYDVIRELTLQEEIMAFSDVSPDSVHREAIEWAAGEGIVTGYPDGTFHPKDDVSREGVCTMLKRFYDGLVAP